MKKDKTGALASPKKIARIAVIVLLCAFLLFWLADYLKTQGFSLSQLFPGFRQEQAKEIHFYPARYGFDIFSDPEYTALDRYLYYTDGGLSTVLVDENQDSEVGGAVPMLRQYFDSIIQGDADTYRSFFSKAYQEKNDLPSNFTMQRLYQITIELLSVQDLNLDGADLQARYEYKISYMIQKNDGTFRSDVGSDAAVPEIYILYEDISGNILIDDILALRSAK